MRLEGIHTPVRFEFTILACNKAMPSHQSVVPPSQRQAPAYGRRSSRHESGEFCFRFNNNTCLLNGSCTRRHICLNCSGAHPRKVCSRWSEPNASWAREKAVSLDDGGRSGPIQTLPMRRVYLPAFRVLTLCALPLRALPHTHRPLSPALTPHLLLIHRPLSPALTPHLLFLGL